MTILSYSYADQGQWKEARKLGHEMLDAQRRILGEDDRGTLLSISNLAGYYNRLGESGEDGLCYSTLRRICRLLFYQALFNASRHQEPYF